MSFKELEVVVLRRDMPTSGLKAGDLGTVVQTYGPDDIEVEFVTASGHTEALLTLKSSDVRSVANNDLISVRSITGAA